MRIPARRLSLWAAIPLAAVLLAGCTAPEDDPAPSTPTSTSPATGADAGTDAGGPDSTVYPMPTGVEFDYQLGGAYQPGPNVGIVERDSTEDPAEGVYSICYVNGFQTQPQDSASFAKAHPDLYLKDADGDPVIDENWPDEMILDTSTAAKRTEIASIVGETISLCKTKNFDAVEFDNLDSYTRSDGALTRRDNLDAATLFTAAAHALGLSAAQKNSVEIGAAGRDDVKFDLVVAEECAQFDECAAYTDVYADRVIDIEYSDALKRPFATVCSDPATPPMTILRDRDLVTPDDADYVYESCAALAG